MTLKPALTDREYDKFEDIGGLTHVRTTGTITSTPSGLGTSGKVSIVAIDNSTWTALPTTALTGRNAIGIQNYSGQEIKLNFDNTTVGYVGIVMPDSTERFYDIKETIIVYAKSSTSSCNVTVEEIA